MLASKFSVFWKVISEYEEKGVCHLHGRTLFLKKWRNNHIGFRISLFISPFFREIRSSDQTEEQELKSKDLGFVSWWTKYS